VSTPYLTRAVKSLLVKITGQAIILSTKAVGYAVISCYRGNQQRRIKIDEVSLSQESDINHRTRRGKRKQSVPVKTVHPDLVST